MSRNKFEISILPDIGKKLEHFATNLEDFSIYEYEKCQIHWERESNPLELLHYEGSPLCSTLKVQRDPFTGEIVDFCEVPLKAAGATAQNSMLMNRAPLPLSKATKGSPSFIPFCPGSFSVDDLNLPKYKEFSTSELLTIPPGFSRGLTFGSDGVTVVKEDEVGTASKKIPEQKHVINLLELAKNEQNLLGTWGSAKKDPEEDSENIEQPFTEEESVIPKEPLVLNISETPPINRGKCSDWAVLLDTSKPVTDFKEKVPNMACEFSFELDIFQKLAVIQLEQHNHVFVSAHTSAGKTVVAEYAIALSQKHMTRTIYTSPIKALSNQKYRDFREKFNDVGLITGDFQTNETASCLIMTTEILRSMLYGGSDITRDLEYVIFDEVHYINDRERGHVWEQVLILLPAHVCVVLLSATVPNPMEFADWLGGIHQKKVYVIKTEKRPVPLQHFLYTGTDGKTKGNKFAILDDNDWKMGGYIQAKNSILESKTDKRGSDRKQFTEKQDKTLWTALIDHLRKEELLPVVAFIFSRARCDRNASSIINCVDLTTEKEKAKITMFYKKCIINLKESDREIPQVQFMGELLRKGIGVHHSGVLPIIKEIVEMLFQSGRIKLLFATETFAMGVNMPARTVVFDCVSKHDGRQWRPLEASEYKQMAGRAGRRGLDKKGTVIILCKNQITPEITLKEMMKGNPQKLRSQFRLTYGMVLSILRVESWTVERIMSLSYLEAEHQKNKAVLVEELKKVETEISELCNDELSSYLTPLVEYFDSAIEYFKYRNQIMSSVFVHPKVQKVMTPGRILLITWQNHISKLALLLSVSRGAQSFEVFILTDKKTQSCELDDKTDLWYKMLALASETVYCPTEDVSHAVVVIGALDILEITGKSIKISTELILSDWNKRQSTRFKNDPPGQTTVKAAQELHKLSLSTNESGLGTLEPLHFISDIHVDDTDLYTNLISMYGLKEKVNACLSGTRIPNFMEQFSIVFTKKYLEEKREYIKHNLSFDSLTLYEDYQNRITLLRKLSYVDKNNIVKLKGRVACEIGMNELLITEIVARKILDDLEPAEVAALLSVLVFQVRARNQDESEEGLLADVTPPLRKAIEVLKGIHMEIVKLEASLKIRSEEIPDELNFGVVKIVYEWASNKSFAEIMYHTYYQEGIIVRCIQQLNDTICDVRDGAKIIGNPTLKSKMEDASNAIKRDIVFAESLYTRSPNN